jgi:hypothetical protein
LLTAAAAPHPIPAGPAYCGGVRKHVEGVLAWRRTSNALLQGFLAEIAGEERGLDGPERRKLLACSGTCVAAAVHRSADAAQRGAAERRCT